MKVWEASILGLLGGLILGGVLASYFEVIVFIVGLAGVIQVITRKRVLTGPLGGFLIGLAAGYFARGLLVP